MKALDIEGVISNADESDITDAQAELLMDTLIEAIESIDMECFISLRVNRDEENINADE